MKFRRKSYKYGKNRKCVTKKCKKCNTLKGKKRRCVKSRRIIRGGALPGPRPPLPPPPSPDDEERRRHVRRLIDEFMEELGDPDFIPQGEIERIINKSIRDRLSDEQINEGLNDWSHDLGVFASWQS